MDDLLALTRSLEQCLNQRFAPRATTWIVNERAFRRYCSRLSSPMITCKEASSETNDILFHTLINLHYSSLTRRQRLILQKSFGI